MRPGRCNGIRGKGERWRKRRQLRCQFGLQVADMMRAGEKRQALAGEIRRVAGGDVREELCKSSVRCHVR